MRTDYGAAVRGGIIHHLSASSLSKADPSQEGGCFRRWLYHYVLGFKEPFTTSQRIGVETHDIAEAYYKYESDSLNPLLIAARHFMPPRHTSIEAEHEIPWGSLQIAGVPVVGLIDLINPTHVTTDETGQIIYDPEDVVEVLDWKTTSNVVAWGKLSGALIETNQMALYANYIVASTSGDKRPRISHVYMQSKGKNVSAKATDVPSLRKIDDRWVAMTKVARYLIDVAGESDASKVPANRNACPAWGGCPQKSRCPVSKSQTLVDLFGLSKSEAIKGEEVMSLESQMNDLESQQQEAGNVTAVIQGVTDEQFKEAWTVINNADHGVPPLNAKSGEILFRVLGRDDYQGGGTAGQGEYGGLRPLSPDEVITLGANLKPAVAVQPASAPAETPQPSEPRVDSAPVGGEPEEVVLCRELAKKKSWTGQKLDKKGLSVAVRYLLENPTVGDSGQPLVAEKIVVKEVPFDNPVLLAKIADLTKALENKKPDAVASPAESLTVYVDCVPSVPFDQLDDYIASLLRNLEKQCQARDIRCSDHEALSYGKWKGALAAMVREMPPEPGVYMIDTQSEIHAVVAAELRGASEIYVRGIR